MKSEFSKDWVQNWSLIGLQPRHRVIVRQMVDRCKGSAMKDVSPLVTWHVSDVDLQHPGIVVVDCQWYRSWLGNELDNPQSRGVSAIPRSRNQIRLLWDWASPKASEGLFWCTELGFSGIIYDTISLQHWSLAALRNGFISLRQTNPLLEGMELPFLSPASSSRSLTP